MKMSPGKPIFLLVGNKHSSFEVNPTGLHLHIDHPYLGASPDGLVICSCCGPGLLEIKCPYSKRDVDPTLVVDSKFYLKQTSTGTKLCPQHDYYMQVQGQLYVTTVIVILYVGLLKGYT